MKAFLILFFLTFNVVLSHSQSPVGVWQTIDDVSGEPKSHVEIFEKNGKFFGKIVKLLPSAKGTHCNNCTGDNACRFGNTRRFGTL